MKNRRRIHAQCVVYGILSKIRGHSDHLISSTDEFMQYLKIINLTQNYLIATLDVFFIPIFRHPKGRYKNK